MARYDDDEEDEFSNDGSTLADVRRALRASEKKNKQLEQELGSFRIESRKTALAKVIAEKNLNPKIAGLVPKDLSDAEVTDWLDEYGELFAGTAPAQVEDSEPAAQAPEGSAQFNEVANTGSSPASDEGQLMARILSAKTKEDLDLLVHGQVL